jgi:hypothetical protein
MDETQIKSEARLVAIEYMIVNIYAILHRASGAPPESILAIHQKARETLSRESMPGLDPAQSDMIAAEIQAAVEAMLSDVEEMLGLKKTPKR